MSCRNLGQHSESETRDGTVQIFKRKSGYSLVSALTPLRSLGSLPQSMSLQFGFLKSSSKDSVRVLSSISPSRLHILGRHRLSAHHLCVPGVQGSALQTLRDPQTCTNHLPECKIHKHPSLLRLGLPEVTREKRCTSGLYGSRLHPGAGLLWFAVSAALEDSDGVRSYAGATG